MRRLVLVLALLGPCGCGSALLEKAAVVPIRYYTPERVVPRLTSASQVTEMGPTQDRPPAPKLRIGRVTSGIHLRERIVHRDAAFEAGFYEERRWTERPEEFVRRSLSRTLFEERGLTRSLEGGAPTLDVDLLAFDELRRGPMHIARIQLRILLHGDRNVLAEETLTVDRPALGDDMDSFVAAMADALEATSHIVADRAVSALTPASVPANSVR
ncbi:hypothetical protein AKJ09_01273 [Labilithrix luteola]|uniref:ABC-type transport auxiliary lipoprotein component domain-containing protein n=1 Tax=Labilithrix luteola TaxID=1391654 RepID=A0A0K1PNC4_9BACT|nr:ABC-type transport auxiliary lipoprotein family protein [Labilithrix luteola]AKU94609.1 hypothetical protein AKJ09_01273 [Labilithrix luteola]